MEPFLLRIFQSEITTQCRLILLAAEQLQAAMAQLDGPDDSLPLVFEPNESTVNFIARVERSGSEQATRITHPWLALQSIVISAANLSKLLWGGTGKPEQRRKREVERAPLRTSLGVSDTSVLRDPDLRNDFEHFDTRIELWFKGPDRHNYVGRNIVDSGNADPSGIRQDPRFGEYNVTTEVVTFWDHSVRIPDILAEVRRILPVAERESVRPH